MEDAAGVVVVGTSLTAASDAVVRAAAEIAAARGGRLHPAHFLDAEPWPGTGAAAGATPAGEAARAELGAQLRRVGVPPPELDGVTVEVGAAHRGLGELAERRGAELVVVGAAEASLALARLLGATAERVARRAVSPVLVVRGGLSVPPRSVLVTVDLSKPSVAALAAALAWLSGLADGERPRVTLFFAVSPFQGAVGEEEVEVDYTTALEVAGAELARLAQRHGAGLGRRLDTRVRRGFPRQRILDEVARLGADLVVVGSHGRGGYERFLLGSVTASVLRDAPVSVLIFPAREGG